MLWTTIRLIPIFYLIQDLMKMFWYIGEIRPIVTLIISHGLLLRRHLIMRALGLDSMQLSVFSWISSVNKMAAVMPKKDHFVATSKAFRSISEVEKTMSSFVGETTAEVIANICSKMGEKLCLPCFEFLVLEPVMGDMISEF